MDLNEEAVLASKFLALYIEGSDSPRTSTAFAVEKSDGIAGRKPAIINEGGVSTYADWDSVFCGSGEGPEPTDPEGHRFLDRCPVRRAIVTAQTDRLLFVFVGSYGPGQYATVGPRRPHNQKFNPLPDPDPSERVRLPSNQEAGIEIATECLVALQDFLGAEGESLPVGWDYELEWLTADQYKSQYP
jgi:hypothetical protein